MLPALPGFDSEVGSVAALVEFAVAPDFEFAVLPVAGLAALVEFAVLPAAGLAVPDFDFGVEPVAEFEAWTARRQADLSLCWLDFSTHLVYIAPNRYCCCGTHYLPCPSRHCLRAGPAFCLQRQVVWLLPVALVAHDYLLRPCRWH